MSARTEPLALGGTGVTEGDPITAYKWMINEDNTGTNDDPQRDAGRRLLRLDGRRAHDPQRGLPGLLRLDVDRRARKLGPGRGAGHRGRPQRHRRASTLPDGRYLISVLADGFKLDGTPFTLPGRRRPRDRPAAAAPRCRRPRSRPQVFADVTEANGQYDPGEDGLSGLAGQITDYLGQVNTDVFGNPLCTKYEFNDLNNDGVQDPGETIVLDADHVADRHPPGRASASSGDINMDGVVNGDRRRASTSRKGLDPTLARGELTIPNLGTNRYALSMVPPTGDELGPDDHPRGQPRLGRLGDGGRHRLRHRVRRRRRAVPGHHLRLRPRPHGRLLERSGPQVPGRRHRHDQGRRRRRERLHPARRAASTCPTIWASRGAKIDHPIDKPWITLSDLNRGDTAVCVGQGNADGTFEIHNVPDGTYTLTYWDEPQDYILDLLSVTVANGETVDMGMLPLTGWWTKYRRLRLQRPQPQREADAGEPGVPNFTLTLRKRENSLMDRGSTAVDHRPVRLLRHGATPTR